MPSRRFASIAAALALAACAADPGPPPPAPPAPAESAVPSAPAGTCEALDSPLATLRRLAAIVSLGRSMPVGPLDPAAFAAAVEADAARAAGAPSPEPALAGLAADAGARLTAIAAAARLFQRGGDRDKLLAEMERGEIVVLLGEERCGRARAGRRSAAALESTSGRIPVSAFQRAVHAGDPAFGACQQAGLRRDPHLRGAVRVRYVIDPDGSVRAAGDPTLAAPDPLAWGPPSAAAPLPDAEVRACVIAAFRKLTFPHPTGGPASGEWTIELDRR